jgi:sugar-specific transcriptional regulator TrmB
MIMDLWDALAKVGFTRHESELYLILCKEGEMSGYEAAKLSGISRSNAYLALAGLAEKGGAHRIEGETMRYAAVPIAELAANLRREFEETLAYLVQNIPDRSEPSNSFLTVAGEKQVVAKIRQIINQARERIYLALSRAELEFFAPELASAAGRGLKVALITETRPGVEGAIWYRRERQQAGQIRLIADSAVVLTGELRLSQIANCIYSRNLILVQLIKDSLTNEIQLIETKK